jgi:hypothetical protein
MAGPYSDPIHSPMTDEELDRACIAYGALMGEVKFRLRWIDFALQGRTELPPPLVREYSFLQLRMICELIALGCLVIHGDIEQTKTKKFKTHAADEILDNLELLTPDFYPRPFYVDPQSQPGTKALLFPPESTYLTKPQLLNLYRKKCGTALHKGKLSRLIAKPPDDDFSEIPKHSKLIFGLLHTHYVMFSQNTKGVFCEFQDMNAPNVIVTLGAV